jgi:poly-gamma-glutamate capsule biosynthesis protein CapA/YwtB (metallophosphatase superfamily)
MVLNVGKEVAALQRMTVRELRIRYAEVFGESTRAGNKAWLIKRIAWRLQSQAEGGLSERARQRAAELANDADVRLSPPKVKPVTPAAETRTKTATLVVASDDRLPPPGSIVTREYKGQTLQVAVLPHGFEFEGEVYKSLSAVAKAITGQHCNGYHFFRLRKEQNQ